MMYMLLIHSGGAVWERFDALGEEGQKAILGEYLALDEEPGVLAGHQLQPADTATTVRVEDGRTLTTDGPFIEAKEELGGYFLYEADNLDAAIDMAARVPAARMGVRSRCVRSWSASHDRAGLPRRVGPGGRLPRRLRRRFRPRRGRRAGGLRGRRGALAPRRRACEPGRLADDHGPEPRDRPDPPRPHARREDAPARRAGGRGGRDGGDVVSRRAAGADLHLLPSGARVGGAGGLDAARARRPRRGGHRSRVPRARRSAVAGQRRTGRQRGDDGGEGCQGAHRAEATSGRGRV